MVALVWSCGQFKSRGFASNYPLTTKGHMRIRTCTRMFWLLYPYPLSIWVYLWKNNSCAYDTAINICQWLDRPQWDIWASAWISVWYVGHALPKISQARQLTSYKFSFTLEAGTDQAIPSFDSDLMKDQGQGNLILSCISMHDATNNFLKYTQNILIIAWILLLIVVRISGPSESYQRLTASMLIVHNLIHAHLEKLLLCY